MALTVTLRAAHPGGLRRLAAQVSTPGSARYRRFLRPGRLRARFGPPAAATAALRGWLRRHGLTARASSGNGLLLPVTGPAARVEAAFHTPIERVRLAGGRIAQVNSQPPRVPASVRSWVTGVVGLDNLVLPRSGLASKAVAGPPACAAARALPAVYTAGRLARAYQFSALYRRGDYGQHVTVALFELADYAGSDIRAYDDCYGIDPPVRRVRVGGGTSIGANPGGTEEATADIEVTAGLAPRARILVYEAPLAAGAVSTLDNYGAILQQDRAQVVSSSWGICEALAGASYLRAESQLFQEMAVEGQSMMTAAGDAGSEGCLPDLADYPSLAYRPEVGDPAGQPFVTSIGGTMITRYGSPPVQAAWNQTLGGTGFPAPFDGQDGRPSGYPGSMAGGGGISRVWRMPPWQAGSARRGNAGGAPCGAPRGTHCREVPDVSALAAIGTGSSRGYLMYGTAGAFRDQGWLTAGGTSLASPLWAALAALADQQVTGRRLGLLSPSLYRIARADPRALTGVTAGTNDYLAPNGSPAGDTCRYGGAADQPCYRATRGYNMATGLGTPQAGYLIAALRAQRGGRG
jgi:subtilase family serine protease